MRFTRYRTGLRGIDGSEVFNLLLQFKKRYLWELPGLKDQKLGLDFVNRKDFRQAELSRFFNQMAPPTL